ncbi:hypothetical protein HYW17_03050 [Candidatus Uhrbacteria bacterium]|nr:hypothetical protein [Candidatus Uhrbacteria bacterium]
MSNPVSFSFVRVRAEGNYKLTAPCAFICGVAAMMSIWNRKWVEAAILYMVATALRLILGAVMNYMGDPQVVNAWNNKYHRFVVIALNIGVGAVLLGRLGYDWFAHRTHEEPFIALSLAFVIYLIATRFTRPNTFGARVRSATFTVVLIGTMAFLAWPGQWGLCMLAGVLMLTAACLRLRALQRRFGWETR